ncbi:MAG TPA: hypothetical protein VK932_15450 [Kofleriaceae bacterium]|nr:hypothetical protein [Kofleriaceae bacterium]
MSVVAALMTVGPAACGGGEPGASPDGGSPDAGMDPDAPGMDADPTPDAPPAPFTYQAIDAPNPRTRLLYDDARRALYAVNRLDQEIQRFAFAGGTWSALPPVVVPQLTDLAMTPDGQTLIVLGRGAVKEIALAGAFEPVHRADNPDPFCGGFFDKGGATDNGKVLIIFNLAQCSGFSRSYLYDIADHSLTPRTSFYNGIVGASADGSRLYIGSNGVSPAQQVTIYNPMANTMSGSSAAYNLNAVAVSGDASRVILQNTYVYSRALVLLGNVPPGGAVAASRDSSRAFVYRDDAPGPRLDIYDLNGPLQSGALYPLLHTVPLPDAANAMPGTPVSITMATTLDDSVVFVSGNRRVLVVPVNGP